MFKVEFRTENAAFDGSDRAGEIARILHQLAERIAEGLQGSGAVYDVNGNRVGSWHLAEREEDDD